MLTTLLITLAVVGLGAAHWYLSRLRSGWPGAVVPVLWIAALVWFFTRGGTPTALNYVAVVGGSAALAQLWNQGRRAAGPAAAGTR